MTALLERDAELAVLDARLERAFAGEGGVVVLEAPAGAGKTALLAELRRRATRAGATVARAVAGELDRDFPFGVMRQLLGPTIRAVGPERRDALLTGTSALAAPIVDGAAGTSDADGADAFAILHGLYWLVAALADDDGPLVLVVDDAHWADDASLRAVEFLARRVAELPVLLAVASRTDEPGVDYSHLWRLAGSPDAEVLRLHALSDAAVGALVADGLGAQASEQVTAAAARATRGNALLVTELVRTLRRLERPLDAEDVVRAVPASVTRSVQVRLARLPPASRELALALAVLGDRLALDVLARAAEVDLAAAPAALDPLAGAELVEGAPPRFAHPLIRAAVADSVPAGGQELLRRRAIAALRERPADAEQLVVQLLAAAPTGAEWAADALVASGRRALAEGASEAAARRFERALDELPPTSARRAELHLELGRALTATGSPELVRHLEEAGRSGSPAVAGVALTLLGNLGVPSPDTDPDRLLVALQAHPAEDPGGRDRFASAIVDAVTLQRPGERTRVLGALRGPHGPLVSAHLAVEAAAGGAPADEVERLARPALRSELLRDRRSAVRPVYAWPIAALSTVGRPALALAALEEVERTVTRAGTPVGRAFLTYARADLALRVGSALAAETDARESVGLWRSMSFGTMDVAVRATLIEALVLRGELEEADAVARELPDDDALGDSVVGCSALGSRAQLHLARGRAPDAVLDLRRVARHAARLGWRRFPRGSPIVSLARALLATGAREEARSLAEAELAAARTRGVGIDEAAAGTVLGLALGGAAGLEALAAAVAAADPTPSALSRATARLELGAALRRDGRRTEAREHLLIARDEAARADAELVVGRATEQLLLAGARPQRLPRSGSASLSPAERRVAELAASGLSNREIAQALFVTRKTVEFQLGATYAKLGIRSRTQLPEALAA